MHMHMLQADVVRVGHCDDEEATEKSPIVREDSDRTNTTYPFVPYHLGPHRGCTVKVKCTHTNTQSLVQRDSLSPVTSEFVPRSLKKP